MRIFTLGVALFASVALLACGSEQSKEERGLVVDSEEAVPESAAEMDMTEAERQKRMLDEDEEVEDAEFDGNQPGE